MGCTIFFPGSCTLVFLYHLEKMASHGQQMPCKGPGQAHLISSGSNKTVKVSWMAKFRVAKATMLLDCNFVLCYWSFLGQLRFPGMLQFHPMLLELPERLWFGVTLLGQTGIAAASRCVAAQGPFTKPLDKSCGNFF